MSSLLAKIAVGGRLRVEQLLGGLQARAVGEVALLHVAPDSTARPAASMRGLEAFETLRAGGLVRMALDEADAGVAQRDQVLGHLAGGAEIVDAHAGHVSRGSGPVAIATTGMPAAASSEAMAFDSHSGGGRITPATLCASLRAAARSAAGFRSSQFSSTSCAAVRAAPVERADQQLAQVGGAGVGVDQRDARACAPASERAAGFGV